MNIELGDLAFYLPTRIQFGWGKVQEISEICKSYGSQGLLLTMSDIPHGRDVFDKLKGAGLQMTFFDECEPEPSSEGIDRIWETLKDQKFDFMVSVGGGSVIDTTKALRILNATGKNSWEYTIEMGSDMLPIPANLIPQIAVPTTAGTGSEVTCVAVLSNKTLKKKAPIANPQIYPTVALVDPELTLTVPRKVTANTGFDSFAHAYESIFANQTLSPLAWQLCLGGMKMVVDHLEKLLDNPGDRDLRTILSWSATQNGLLLGAVPTGGPSGVHTFALPLAALLKLVHGDSLALAIGPLNRYQIKQKPERARAFSEIFGLDTRNLSVDALEDSVAGALESWMERIGLVTKASQYGAKADMIDQFVENVSLPRVANSFGPDFSKDDIRKIYEACL